MEEELKVKGILTEASLGYRRPCFQKKKKRRARKDNLRREKKKGRI